jgi:hypothetical protein
MSNLGTALVYVLEYEWRIFPCQWRGPNRKSRLTQRGFHDAVRDVAQIAAWWSTSWPDALIGVPTGRESGFVVLDIDVKDDRRNGFDSLAYLGHAILPDTPMAHTGSGGLHLYFTPGPHDIRNTNGERGRGIGPGLDWRGEGGFVIVPSPGSGYDWDPHWNLDTAALAPVPAALLPRQPEARLDAQPIERTEGLSPYVEAALERACRAIIGAPAGQQEETLNGESFSIGRLAGAGGVPAEFARRVLYAAARQIRDYDVRRPWRSHQLEQKVTRAFNAGLQSPREARHAG